MRYALPQSAVSMDHNDKEYQLARKLFDTDKFTSNQEFAPVPLVIFCKYQKYQHWKGDDIGIGKFANFCKEFHHTPSHVGSCITKGIDMGELFR